VTAPFKICRHEFIDHGDYGIAVFYPSAKGDHIGIVVEFAHFRRKEVLGQGASDSVDFIRRDGYADSGATE